MAFGDAAEKHAVAENADMSDREWQLTADRTETLKRISAAVFFAVASFTIVIINKVVLTTYGFPSFQLLGLGQIVVSIVTLALTKQLGLVTYPDCTWKTAEIVWPLPLFFMGNLLCGLGSTQNLNLPMFTVLRRFSILFTMLLELVVLGLLSLHCFRVRPAVSVQLAVLSMIGGAVVASSTDLSFNAWGYFLITINNLCTAGNGVYTKKKLDARSVGRYGLVFYNSLFMLFPIIGITVLNGDYKQAYHFEGWRNIPFLFYFGASCCMGLVLNYATVLCTSLNSALTTTVVGVFKNLVITYLGMIIGNDYVFSWPNFVGLNISVFGSLIYSYVTFKPPPPKTSSNGNV